jgi:hypothetical protein
MAYSWTYGYGNHSQTHAVMCVCMSSFPLASSGHAFSDNEKQFGYRGTTTDDGLTKQRSFLHAFLHAVQYYSSRGR